MAHPTRPMASAVARPVGARPRVGAVPGDRLARRRRVLADPTRDQLVDLFLGYYDDITRLADAAAGPAGGDRADADRDPRADADRDDRAEPEGNDVVQPDAATEGGGLHLAPGPEADGNGVADLLHAGAVGRVRVVRRGGVTVARVIAVRAEPAADDEPDLDYPDDRS